MKVLVIYDSVFGNTEKIAQATGEALASQGEVSVLRVGSAKVDDLRAADLIIVGSPTRGFRPTPEMAAFLKNIPADAIRGKQAAAFDTRVSVEVVKSAILTTMVKFFGYAAEPMARQLKKKGASLCAEPLGFYVKDREGPLLDGELARAADWAGRLIPAG
jgi:flavodoxin